MSEGQHGAFDAIRKKMPRDNTFARWRSVVGLIKPSVVEDPNKRREQIQENIRSKVYGNNYEIVQPNDTEELLQTTSEISKWLAGQVGIRKYIPPRYNENKNDIEMEEAGQIKLRKYTPHTHLIPPQLQEKHNVVRQEGLMYYRGAFDQQAVSHLNEPHYEIEAAREWPDNLSDKIGEFSRYYDSFRFVLHDKGESFYFAVHPDKTYNLDIRFFTPKELPSKQVDEFKPPTLPLSGMPKAELELLKGEFQKFQEIRKELNYHGDQVYWRNPSKT